jgi:hypothetical protein
VKQLFYFYRFHRRSGAGRWHALGKARDSLERDRKHKKDLAEQRKRLIDMCPF